MVEEAVLAVEHQLQRPRQPQAVAMRVVPASSLVRGACLFSSYSMRAPPLTRAGIWRYDGICAEGIRSRSSSNTAQGGQSSMVCYYYRYQQGGGQDPSRRPYLFLYLQSYSRVHCSPCRHD